MSVFAYIPFPNWFEQADRFLFKLINGKWINGVFDVFFPFIRNPYVWGPLYIFGVVFIIANFKKKGMWWFLLAVITAGCTDFVGTNLFKNIFERLRPCRDPEFADQVRMVLGRCSSAFSFVSNHAINHFGLASFFFFTFRHILGWSWIFLVWAGLIGYAQVYVGVHYPFDVVFGSLMGILIGWMTARIFNTKFGFTIFDNQMMQKH